MRRARRGERMRMLLDRCGGQEDDATEARSGGAACENGAGAEDGDGAGSGLELGTGRWRWRRASGAAAGR